MPVPVDRLKRYMACSENKKIQQGIFHQRTILPYAISRNTCAASFAGKSVFEVYTIHLFRYARMYVAICMTLWTTLMIEGFVRARDHQEPSYRFGVQMVHQVVHMWPECMHTQVSIDVSYMTLAGDVCILIDR